MGCDIHMYLEMKVGDGPWKADIHHEVGPFRSCITEKDVDLCSKCEKGQEEHCYEHDNSSPSISATSRDYELFAELAGVRGEGPEPLGLPDDASAEVKSSSDRWGGDGHSHSWVTLDNFRGVLQECGYDVNDSDSIGAFHKWWSENGYNRQAPYTTIVRYCDKLKTDIATDNLLLGRNEDVKFRLVFWFDN